MGTDGHSNLCGAVNERWAPVSRCLRFIEKNIALSGNQILETNQ